MGLKSGGLISRKGVGGGGGEAYVTLRVKNLPALHKRIEPPKQLGERSQGTQ